MSSAAGRKKSVVSTAGLQIETPVANNTFLNKSAAQSTSLYQQCTQLRARLMRIYDFSPYFAINAPSETRTSTDPVTQLWDCFALGVPLCFLFNLLPNVSPISSIDTNPEAIDPADEKSIKKAIVHFAMAIANSTDLFDQSEQFRATQLLDRKSTEGFVKVVSCVTRLVDRLPEDCFQEAPPMSPPSAFPSHETSDSLFHPDSPSLSGPVNAQETTRNRIIREIVETERKYVQDLEHMQKYANALAASSAIDQDTIHLLFPGLSKLLDFQRRLLIKLEGCAELPWKEQRWGLPFIENEEEFAVYEPYCANYSKAVDIKVLVEANLQVVTLIDAKTELTAFLIKPIQRICKYPLLFESLLKATSESDYPYYSELKLGLEAAKRVTDRINEAQRRSENLQTVASLEQRVEDWKGHHLSNFGELILDDIFMVMKMEIDREYHVFLFEKIILCCKEVVQQVTGGSTRKGSKSNSILKKHPASLPGGVGPPRKKNTPLLLKGRIFLNNVTHTKAQVIATGQPTPSYSLQVWWRGDDDNEYFTLRCRTEEQLKQWDSAIKRLIEKTQARKNSNSSMHQANSTNPSQSRMLYDASRKFSTASGYSAYSSGMPMSAASSSMGRRYNAPPYEYDDQRSRADSVASGIYFGSGAGPSGYPQDDDVESEENYEEYPPAAQYASSSGRGTPLGSRRGNVSQSMLQERDAVSAYDRPRARTEDQNGPLMRQWRKNGQSMPAPPPPPMGALPNPMANMSRPQGPPRVASDASEASFGSAGTIRTQPASLRSKFSSNRLNSAYDNESDRAGSPLTRAPSRPPMRSRSQSQPSAYHPPPQAEVPPPLPKSLWAESTTGSVTGSVTSSAESSKRGSGSSESTGDSSEYSPHSTSPITPFGSSDSSLAGATLRTSRSQVLTKTGNGVPQIGISPMVKVKVHFLEDIFVIQVPRSTEYEELVEKVGKKIRLCGPRREDGPLKVKYIDEDGDMVSLGSTEDVQMAFETMRPGNQVTLYVS